MPSTAAAAPGPLATPVTVNLENGRGIFHNREPSALTDLIR
jgi:hypothetical protein